MGTRYHPHLIKALRRVVVSENAENHYLENAIDVIVADHLGGLSEWLDSIEDILKKNKEDTHLSVSAKEDDDFALCQFAIEDWEAHDRAMGMRYNAIVKRYQDVFSRISTVTIRQKVLEQLKAQEVKIQDLAKRANDLAKEWQSRLSEHRFNKLIAIQLSWLSQVTPEELIKNYERWEKERL